MFGSSESDQLNMRLISLSPLRMTDHSHGHASCYIFLCLAQTHCKLTFEEPIFLCLAVSDHLRCSGEEKEVKSATLYMPSDRLLYALFIACKYSSSIRCAQVEAGGVEAVT